MVVVDATSAEAEWAQLAVVIGDLRLRLRPAWIEVGKREPLKVGRARLPIEKILGSAKAISD
jgi:hypothetical protein